MYKKITIKEISKWTDIDWACIELNVFNLQRKNYDYSKANKINKVHYYKKLFVKSSTIVYISIVNKALVRETFLSVGAVWWETVTYGFGLEGTLVIKTSTIILSHPDVEEDIKGLTVRQLKWYMSWV